MINDINMNTIMNALTVDVEDYYQVSAFENVIKRDDWHQYNSRVYRNTMELLDLFDNAGISATFFVLGMVAEKCPDIIREIVSRKHEVACHGYSHNMITNQSIDVFKEETIKAKSVIEEQAQEEVIGYRAASFSITNSSLWALDVLYETGFKYDSSVFPVHHDRYGIPGSPHEPYILNLKNNMSLIEFPMTVKKIGNINVPVGGGGYFRLYPYLVTKTLLKSINNKEKRPFVFYIHPWEIDPEQPRIQCGLVSKFRHYNNLQKCKNRLVRLVDDFKFTTIRNVLHDSSLLSYE